MQGKNAMVPLLIALIVAGVYFMSLASKEKSLSKSYDEVQVIVAKTELPARTVITPDRVDIQKIPRRFVQQDVYEVRSPSDLKMVSNLVTAIRIPKGNQIVQSALISLSPEAGLSVKVPPGYRGAVLEIGNDVSGLVKPGDRIDVLVTFEAMMSDNRKEKVTATILQNVLVLGVGSNLGQGMDAATAGKKDKQEAASSAFSDKGLLSVALNPNEAQYLALSKQQGDISIVVRGLGDLEMHPMEMASFRKLFK